MRKTNTGEPYVSLNRGGRAKDGHDYASRVCYAVFSGANTRTTRPSRRFPATAEGFADAVAYRDRILAGLGPDVEGEGDDSWEVVTIFEGERRTVTRTRTEATRRSAKLIRERKDALGDECEAPGCPIPRQELDGVSWTDGAHVEPVSSGEREVTVNDFVLLCPTHHRIFDHGGEL